MKKINFDSIVVKLTVIVLGIVLSTLAIVTYSVLMSGVLESLEAASYLSFSDSSKTHKAFVEKRMTADISNIFTFASDIVEIYEDEEMNINQGLDSENIDLLLSKSAPYLEDMLNASYTTGAFVVLNTNDGVGKYDILYLYDHDPLRVRRSNDDLTIYNSSEQVAELLKDNYQKHVNWSNEFILNEDNIDVLQTPLKYSRDSQDNTDLRTLGYWQVSKSITQNNTSTLTYSLPLVTDEGDELGVFGISITEEYFYQIFPSYIIDDNALGYALVHSLKGTDEIIPLLVHGEEAEALLPVNEIIQLGEELEKYDMYLTNELHENSEIVIEFDTLELYDSIDFEEERWAFVSLADKSTLDNQRNNFIKVYSFSILAVLLFSILIVYFVSKIFSAPVVRLANKVKSNDINIIQSLSLSKTGFSETDSLARAIERFSRKEREASFKTDKILEMVKLPLGTFEYEVYAEEVECSKNLISILDLDDSLINDGKISRINFENAIDDIKTRKEDGYDSVYHVKLDGERWVEIISTQNDGKIIGICMDVSDNVIEKKKITFERDHDELTHLLNRTAFKKKVAACFEEGIEGIAAFVTFDLDNLKYVNDTYGHDYGDQYIQNVARIMADTLKDNCVLARLSGDEFYVFLHSYETREALLDDLEHVYECFEKENMMLPDSSEYKYRMSGGLAWYGSDADNLYDLIQYADFAIYQGKQVAKGKINHFDYDQYAHESYMLHGTEELNRVLDFELVKFAFQPIVDARTGQCFGYETLMRPQSKLLNSPIKLIKLATAQSRLQRVEQLTFLKNLAYYKENVNEFNGAKLFINSIPNEFLSEGDFKIIYENYTSILSNVVVEITEIEQLNYDILQQKKEEAHNWGAQFALDDYGSGYNSDISLLSLKPSIVKIDRGLITDIENDKNRQSMLTKLIQYAREQDIIILAEGVETYSQMRYLIHAGVDCLQGYYIAKPQFTLDYDRDKIEREIIEIVKEL